MVAILQRSMAYLERMVDGKKKAVPWASNYCLFISFVLFVFSKERIFRSRGRKQSDLLMRERTQSFVFQINRHYKISLKINGIN